MILLFSDGFPKSGKRLIFKLVDRMIHSVHCRRPHVIVGAGAFNACDKTDIAFIIAGRSVKECGKLFGFDQGISRLVILAR